MSPRTRLELHKRLCRIQHRRMGRLPGSLFCFPGLSRHAKFLTVSGAPGLVSRFAETTAKRCRVDPPGSIALLLRACHDAGCMEKAEAMDPAKAEKLKRDREKTELLERFQRFAERSHWSKRRLAREVGVTPMAIGKWLRGTARMELASMLAIRRFLEEQG